MALDLSFFTSDTSMRLREEGRAEGRVWEVADAVLRVLAVRGVEVSAQTEERVRSCKELEVLHAWLKRALEVSTAAELLAESV
ncbi:hypothetical protein ACFV3R_15670 [Streptomyces sp. NPDC059740]|uniref:hypothetical protein n=1 Tax=Streptomyces sp. NPDC059740 TaxID=3346926 RepID=UPI003662E0E5